MDEMTTAIILGMLLLQVVALGLMHANLGSKVDSLKALQCQLTDDLRFLKDRVRALEAKEDDSESKPFDPETATDEELIREAARKFHGLQ